MATYTANLNLYNPSLGEVGWKDEWDTNFSILDTSIGTYLNADGSFKAATASAIPFSASGFTADNVKDAIIEAYDNASTTSWGDILGTLTDQLDLLSALNLKYDSSDFNTDWDSRLGSKTTDNISEGLSNLYDQTVALTPGTGIGISGTYPNFTISNTQTSAAWGNITGTLSNQTDLQNALDLKALISGQVFTGAISATNLSGTNTGDQTSVVEDITLSATNISNKYVDLENTPLDDTEVVVFPYGGIKQFHTSDFTLITDGVSIKRVTWVGLNLETLLEEGDVVSIKYTY